MKVDYKELSNNGEKWEQFAREFLEELGYVVQSPPDRGPDGGKDLLITENVKGRLGTYPMRWLVSCKNYAQRGASVGVGDEVNILERLEQHGAVGFIGFYSTIPSSSLNERLSDLKSASKITDYSIFDGERIESLLIKSGFSHLMARFFPKSYVLVAPVRNVIDRYLPLKCENCYKDILENIEHGIGYAITFIKIYEEDVGEEVLDIYWSCKGDCDSKLRKRYLILYSGENSQVYDGWEDIPDLCIPAMYLRWNLNIMNQLRLSTRKYGDVAFEKLRWFIICLSQKILRESSAKELELFSNISNLSDIVDSQPKSD